MTYPIEMCSTLREIAEKRAATAPKSTVFVSGNFGGDARHIAAEAFERQTARLGAWLLREGFRHRHIAILGENTYGWILALFAVSGSGNTAVLADKSQPIKSLLPQLIFADCAAVLFTEQYRSEAEALRDAAEMPVFSLEELESASAESDFVTPADLRAYENDPPEPDSPALIAFTSGSSALAKSVVLSNRSVAFDAVKSARQSDLVGNCLLLLPLYHMFGIIGILCSFVSGGTVYISRSLRYIRKDVAAVRPRFITAVPSMLPALSEAFSACGAVEGARIICGGAAGGMAWQQSFREAGVRLFNGYGMTECSPVIAFMTEDRDGEDGFMQPIEGCTVRIAEPDENGVGEILVQGENVMIGYYKQSEETEAALAGGWLHTGDLGRMNNEGLLTVVGRKKNLLVLSNGENVAPEPLEERASRIEGVAECMAAECGGVLQMEIYAPDADQVAILDAMKELNRALPANKRIMKTVFREREFEKNSVGKCIRKKY